MGVERSNVGGQSKMLVLPESKRWSQATASLNVDCSLLSQAVYRIRQDVIEQ